MSSVPTQRSPGLAEQAATVIEELARAAPPGSRLGTKAALRELADVSVGTFNEALRLVQSRGLVTVRPGPGGGLFARTQSPMVRLGNSVLALDSHEADAVQQAVRIRDVLDPLLVEDAILHASPAHLGHMREILAEMRAAAVDASATDFVHANWALHRYIADISPATILSSVYLAMLELIETNTLEVLPLQGQPLPEYLLERCDLHAAIVDAIADRDSQRAALLMDEHSTIAKLSDDSEI